MMEMLDIFTRSHYHALTYYHHRPHYLLSAPQPSRYQSCQNATYISRSLKDPMRVENIQINHHNHQSSHRSTHALVTILHYYDIYIYIYLPSHLLPSLANVTTMPSTQPLPFLLFYHTSPLPPPHPNTPPSPLHRPLNPRNKPHFILLPVDFGNSFTTAFVCMRDISGGVARAFDGADGVPYEGSVRQERGCVGVCGGRLFEGR